MKKTLLIAALTTLATTPLIAAPVDYTIDNNHTFPRFSYNHLGFSTQISRFNKTTGTVTLDAEAKTGAVDVTIDMSSVDTGSETFDGHIQKADMLDTATYPTATFKSTKVTFNGDAPASIEGNLTIKGITHPVTLTVTGFKSMAHPMLKRPAIGANATTVIKRSDFNASKHVPYVGDEVTLDISLEAVAK
ncbi:MAG: polyisoprenoid-binding protein [Rhodocyclaceae bacterium]|nr:polyisoprenoid-binding protein [Rhodocyclaceae bacterium]